MKHDPHELQAHSYNQAVSWLTKGQHLRTALLEPYPQQHEGEDAEDYRQRLRSWVEIATRLNKIEKTRYRAAITALDTARRMYEELTKEL